MMTQKERLVELLKWAIDEAECGYNQYQSEYYEVAADYLLQNGVIVPPCKVGDTVWFKHLNDNDDWTIEKGETTAIVKRDVGDYIEIQHDRWLLGRSFDEVFLTREEAEQALKERSVKHEFVQKDRQSAQIRQKMGR